MSALYQRVSHCVTRTHESTGDVARCSSVVRAFAHGAMGRLIDHSWWTPRAISRSSQCSTTVVTKAMICLSSLLDGAYKRTFAANQKE